MSAAAQSAPVTEHVLTICRLPAGIQPDAPFRMLVSAREDPPFAGSRTGRTLRLTWHLLSALPRGALPGTVSAVFTPGRRGLPGRVAMAPRWPGAGPAAARMRHRHLAFAAACRMGRHAAGGYPG